jgi:hypothetical protein
MAFVPELLESHENVATKMRSVVEESSWLVIIGGQHDKRHPLQDND